jgi:ABC-2 type transport system ATP-binding protein
VEVEFATPAPLEAIAKATGVSDVEAAGRRLTCTVRGSFESLMSALRDQPVLNLVSHEPTLEEVFLTYYRADAAGPEVEEA